VSFGIGVLAIDGWTEVAEVLAMVDRCHESVHVEGELDQRIVGFYERLRAAFPDHPPYLDPDQNPWMSMPLDIGIDHVFMLLSYGERSHPALEMIQDLATEYGLTIWDPQEDSAYRPVRGPSREQVAAWWLDLHDGRCSRAETHERARPWVEETPEAVDDPIVSMGVQQLYGFALSDPRHGDQECRALFERWLAHGERFDADPEGWERDRVIAAVQAIRRDQGPERAQALALQLAARGSLSAEDVIRILGADS
jgi:hypothetical protein